MTMKTSKDGDASATRSSEISRICYPSDAIPEEDMMDPRPLSRVLHGGQIRDHELIIDSGDDLLEGGFEWFDHDRSSTAEEEIRHGSSPPEVNLKNILSGMLTILTGRSKASPVSPSPGSNISFFDDGENAMMHSSVHMPSAPPLYDSRMIIDYGACKESLEAEPPEWAPDSSAKECMQCAAPFTAVVRGRHHCRFCGGIFCSACTRGRCLMPVRFRERNPQRVCDACYDRLDPLQGILINGNSNAAQSAKHDVVDWTCGRAWLNLPLGFSMEHEIHKACGTITAYCQVARLNPERAIAPSVLRNAAGLALITVARAGAFLTCRFGTGLVLARRADGSWSAPSAVSSVGVGWGPQFGGELVDFIVALHGPSAVRTFCSRMHVSVGAACSAALGPVGRAAEADVRANHRGCGVCYTYSCTRGAFVGVSLEGTAVSASLDVNRRFYGDPYLTPADILTGLVDPPKAARPLYNALTHLYHHINAPLA